MLKTYNRATVLTFRISFISEFFLGLILLIAVTFLAVSLPTLREQKSKKKFTENLCFFIGNILLLLAATLRILFSFFSVETCVTFYFISNDFTRFFQRLVLLSSAFILHHSTEVKTLLEYPLLLLLRVWFLLLLISANHFLTVFLTLIGFSLNLYVLIRRFDTKYKVTLAHEASIKYFYLSSFSTALILISFTLLFIVSLTWNFAEYEFFSTVFVQQKNNFFGWQSRILVAIIGTILGFTFKLSAFPANFWAPEVYEGSATQITAFIIMPVKIACLSLFARILVSLFATFQEFWSPVICFAACGSLIIGAWGALTEKKFKRFIAYSSINQRGFRLLGLLNGSFSGLQACFIFLILYIITNIVLFFYIFRIQNKITEEKLVFLTDFARLDNDYWSARFALSRVFFSLAGIPPFAGFFSKYFLLVHTFQQGYTLAVFFGILTSLISTYYYLRRVKLLWFVKQGTYATRNFSLTTGQFFWKIFIFFSLSFLTFFVFFLDYVLQFTAILSHSCIFPTL